MLIKDYSRSYWVWESPNVVYWLQYLSDKTVRGVKKLEAVGIEGTAVLLQTSLSEIVTIQDKFMVLPVYFDDSFNRQVCIMILDLEKKLDRIELYDSTGQVLLSTLTGWESHDNR